MEVHRIGPGFTLYKQTPEEREAELATFLERRETSVSPEQDRELRRLNGKI